MSALDIAFNLAIIFMVVMTTWIVLTSATSFMRKHAKAVKKAGEHFDVAYEAAQILLKDKSVPVHVVKFVAVFMQRAGDGKLARSITRSVFVDLFRGEVNRHAGRRTEETHALSRDLETLNIAQRTAFDRMIVEGFISSAYADPWFKRLDLVIFALLTSSDMNNKTVTPDRISHERANKVVIDLSDRYCGLNGDQPRHGWARNKAQHAA